nr:PREDICTED: uncharacterized protein LOC106702719 [Latimeria chalumnae]|eukprot:XP_014341205.1 PREDICTED: uncharacterized protein LOC106702719 [Latimeria chalumnae]
MSNILMRLPNITHSSLNAGDSSSLKVEGRGSSFASKIKNERLFESRRHSQNYEDVKVRALTARPEFYTRAASWAAESVRTNEVNPRAQTALMRLSMDVLPKQRLNSHEIIMLIKEKVNSSYSSIRQMFQTNDPKGEGTVSKEALARILWNICGYLTSQQINNLLNSVQLAENTSFSFDEFISCFQDTKVKMKC